MKSLNEIINILKETRGLKDTFGDKNEYIVETRLIKNNRQWGFDTRITHKGKEVGTEKGTDAPHGDTEDIWNQFIKEVSEKHLAKCSKIMKLIENDKIRGDKNRLNGKNLIFLLVAFLLGAGSLFLLIKLIPGCVPSQNEKYLKEIQAKIIEEENRLKILQASIPTNVQDQLKKIQDQIKEEEKRLKDLQSQKKGEEERLNKVQIQIAAEETRWKNLASIPTNAQDQLKKYQDQIKEEEKRLKDLQSQKKGEEERLNKLQVQIQEEDKLLAQKKGEADRLNKLHVQIKEADKRLKETKAELVVLDRKRSELILNPPPCK